MMAQTEPEPRGAPDAATQQILGRALAGAFWILIVVLFAVSGAFFG